MAGQDRDATVIPLPIIFHPPEMDLVVATSRCQYGAIGAKCDSVDRDGMGVGVEPVLARGIVPRERIRTQRAVIASDREHGVRSVECHARDSLGGPLNWPEGCDARLCAP